MLEEPFEIAQSKYRGMNPDFVKRVWARRAEREADEAKAEQRRQGLEVLWQRKVPKWAAQLIVDTAAEHDVEPLQILFANRRLRVIAARREAIYRVKAEKPMLSSPRIAGWFGLDHTTILHSLARYSDTTGAPRLSFYQTRELKK